MGLKLIEGTIKGLKTGTAYIEMTGTGAKENFQFDYHKCGESGDVQIEVDDKEELVSKPVTVVLADFTDKSASEYKGSFDKDGKFVSTS